MHILDIGIPVHSKKTSIKLWLMLIQIPLFYLMFLNINKLNLVMFSIFLSLILKDENLLNNSRLINYMQ